MFRIEMLPAIQGDALWIEYGNDRKRRILIDGGPIGAYAALENKLKALPENDKRVELLVVTHVDTDHIESAIRLLAAPRKSWLIEPADIWFNGWRHLRKSNVLGGREGDFLSALISRRAFEKWNKAFNREAIAAESEQPPPIVTLEEGMKITLLSPNRQRLETMAEKWGKDVDKHGLKPGDLDKAWQQLVAQTKYHVAKGVLGGGDDLGKRLAKQLKTDQSTANGSSIAFLAEFDNKSCLFLADANDDVVCDAITKLIPEGQKQLKVDAVKMSHHGSRNNISQRFLELVDARHFLISTNGAIHEHPDKAALDAVIHWAAQKPTLWFNYKSKFNEPWMNNPSDEEKGFIACYPDNPMGGISIDL